MVVEQRSSVGCRNCIRVWWLPSRTLNWMSSPSSAISCVNRKIVQRTGEADLELTEPSIHGIRIRIHALHDCYYIYSFIPVCACVNIYILILIAIATSTRDKISAPDIMCCDTYVSIL